MASALAFAILFPAPPACADGEGTDVWIDPITRYVHLTYNVPEDAPDAVTVRCEWSPAGRDDFRPAKVVPLISETAQNLVDDLEWNRWVYEGRVVERRAAGLQRTVVWNPYADAQPAGTVDADMRVTIEDAEGNVLAQHQHRVQADNSDVVYIEDWTRVLQRDAFAENPSPEECKWCFARDVDTRVGASFGNALYGSSPPDVGLRPLTYPLALKGWYAISVRSGPGTGGVRLRLTGDERTDQVPGRLHEEVLWRWTRMDRQHLVLNQPHEYTGYTTAYIDYVKLVPLTDELVTQLEAPFQGERDKLVAGYWEPYSWAFHTKISETTQHRHPLTAYVEAQVPIVDMQIGRFGAKVVYESRETDQLLYATRGDPIGKVANPTTDNVGRMQQYTNTLDAGLRYARELGLTLHANFGATNCYPGSPLQGDFARDHPEWVRSSALRYEVPEVRKYILSIFREALEAGAPAISIDFCRYPQGIDTAETCTEFLRALRGLADEFGVARSERVPILIRFPALGVRQWQDFDYATWVKEGLVDILCPSNIQGRHLHFGVEPYLDATRGTDVKLMPVVDGLCWGPRMPGPFLWRVRQLYEAGVDGVYVYQADARVLGKPVDRRTMRLLGSSQAIEAWWTREEAMRKRRSKGIYVSRPCHEPGWHGWERLRVWTEGIEPGPVEFLLDGELVHRCDGPPYLLGEDDYDSDAVIPAGEPKLLIRARDGDGWLERELHIVGA